jgi:uncharacterized membrane protein
LLAAILAIGAGVWVGGLATVIILSASSRKTIAAADRVPLFRDFGRRFAGFMGVTALLVVAPALVLASAAPGPLTASVLLLALGLLVGTAVGILQARRMTKLREAAAEPAGAADTGRLRRNATIAAALRIILVLGYLALLALAVLQASVA